MSPMLITPPSETEITTDRLVVLMRVECAPEHCDAFREWMHTRGAFPEKMLHSGLGVWIGLWVPDDARKVRTFIKTLNSKAPA